MYRMNEDVKLSSQLNNKKKKRHTQKKNRLNESKTLRVSNKDSNVFVS